MKNLEKYLSSPEFLILFVIFISTIFSNLLISIIMSNSREYYEIYDYCYNNVFGDYYCEVRK